jgi:methionyl-tRNA formyltransferase
VIRFVLVGDAPGIQQLLRYMPNEVVVGIVGAFIRMHYLEDLQKIADKMAVPFLIQPKWKSEEYEAFVKKLAELSPDIIWVNSYSMIIRDDVLSIPLLGAINVHGAYLPRNRGCNPIQWAIIKREHKTGVTLHCIDSGLDTGPIIAQETVDIKMNDSWLDVRNKINNATDVLIEDSLKRILSGNWKTISQNEQMATLGARRKAEDGFFRWSEPAIDIYNKIRALLPPIPPAYYINASGEKVYMTEILPFWELISLKAVQFSNELLQGHVVLLLPVSSLTIGDLNLRFVLFAKEKKFLMDVDSSDINQLCFEIKKSTSNEILGAGFLTNINWTEGEAELVLESAMEHNLLAYSSWYEAAKLISEIGFEEFLFKRIYIRIDEANKNAKSVLENYRLSVLAD